MQSLIKNYFHHDVQFKHLHEAIPNEESCFCNPLILMLTKTLIYNVTHRISLHVIRPNIISKHVPPNDPAINKAQSAVNFFAGNSNNKAL